MQKSPLLFKTGKFVKGGQNRCDRSVGVSPANCLTVIRKGFCTSDEVAANRIDGNHDPHYTWGALLDLIGLESIVDVDDSGQIVLNGNQTKTIALANIPLLGRTYDVKTFPGSAVLLYDGKVVLRANGTIVRSAITNPTVQVLTIPSDAPVK